MRTHHVHACLLSLSCACASTDAGGASTDRAEASLQTSDHRARADLFFNPVPGTGGNGRACETCHMAGDAFQLSPARVEARWQRLQRAREQYPYADDPLFRAIDADDLAEDFTRLREHGLVRVLIDLPRDADGNKLVWPVDDPDAGQVELFRAVPSIANVALTAPYQYDGRFATLEKQAQGALRAHAQISHDPAPGVLDDIAGFERSVFSSERVAALADVLAAGEAPEAAADVSLSALQQHGKALFEHDCAICHGGPRQTQPSPELASLPGLRDIFLSRPLPPFAADLPFADSPVADRVRTWAVRVPDQEQPTLRDSTDPGRVLQTGKLDDFNTFEIPALFGIGQTAPYFRDNSAGSLTEVIMHYQQLFEAVRRVVPPETAYPLRPDPISAEDFAPLIAYLQSL